MHVIDLTNVKSVISPFVSQVAYTNIYEHIQEKNHTNVMFVVKHLLV